MDPDPPNIFPSGASGTGPKPGRFPSKVQASLWRLITEIGDSVRYINTGCWLPPLPGQDHVIPELPCTCRLSHVVVEKDGQADLRVFCKATRTVRGSDVKKTDLRCGDLEEEPLLSAETVATGS